MKRKIDFQMINGITYVFKFDTSKVFNDQQYIGVYRKMRMVGSIEQVNNKESKVTFPSEDRVGYKIYQICGI